MRLAHQNHAGARFQLHQPAKRAQRFGDPLVRLEMAERPDQRRRFVEPSSWRAALRIRSAGKPCAVRNGRDRARKSLLPRQPRDEIAVNDQAFEAWSSRRVIGTPS